MVLTAEFVSVTYGVLYVHFNWSYLTRKFYFKPVSNIFAFLLCTNYLMDKLLVRRSGVFAKHPLTFE